MVNTLLLIDIQNDFCENGKLEVSGSSKIIPTVNSIINYAKSHNFLIVATKDWHPKDHKSFASVSNKKIGDIGKLNGLLQVWWPDHCIQNTVGSEFHPKLLKEKIDFVVYKGESKEIDSYSGFFDNGKKNKTKLHKYLQENNVNTLYIAGLATDFCVKYTALDALFLGYTVYIIKDACKGVELELGDIGNSLNELKEKGAILINSYEIHDTLIATGEKN